MSTVRRTMSRALTAMAVVGILFTGCSRKTEDGADTPENDKTASPKDKTNTKTNSVARVPQPKQPVDPGPVPPNPDKTPTTKPKQPEQNPDTQPKTTKQPVAKADPNSPEALDKALANLKIPPAWLADVRPRYDTSNPWKKARIEIRRLLGQNREAERREAIKLTWLYLQKNDIGNGHEYPMYLFPRQRAGLGDSRLRRVAQEAAPQHSDVRVQGAGRTLRALRQIRQSQISARWRTGTPAETPVEDHAGSRRLRRLR